MDLKLASLYEGDSGGSDCCVTDLGTIEGFIGHFAETCGGVTTEFYVQDAFLGDEDFLNRLLAMETMHGRVWAYYDSSTGEVFNISESTIPGVLGPIQLEVREFVMSYCGDEVIDRNRIRSFWIESPWLNYNVVLSYTSYQNSISRWSAFVNAKND